MKDDTISRAAAIDTLQPEQKDFEKQLHDMFDHIWDCKIDHPEFQDTVGDLMRAVIQAHNNSVQPEEAAQPEQDREFMKLTVRNSNGRPYYSIIFLEFDDNGIGHDFEGYSSYSLDVISDYLKKYFMPSAQPRWIPVTERLPENRVCVIVCFREWQQYANRYIYSIVNGWYARKHSVRENEFSEWEADCDYDEDEDEYYILEGWYEFTTQGNDDLMNWYINAEVVAWMPLPEPYREEGGNA